MRTVTQGVGGLVLLAAGLVVLLGRGEVLRHSHPVHGLTVVAVVVAGVVLLVLAVRSRVRGGGGRRPARHPRLAGTGRVLLGVLALVVAASLLWSRPAAATAPARDALLGDARVQVRQHLGTITLTPAVLDPDAPGLVFTPGARVDPRAYTALLRPLAEAGHLVVVVPPPFGIALLDPDQSAQAVRDHPEVVRWVAGGHSLGGVSASGWAGDHAGDEAVGLLLWASYPIQDLSGSPLRVCSVSGSEDGLSTPADIADSRALLPADTRFSEVPGAVHAFFGDYGEQGGDGTPTVSRGAAQDAVVAASLECLG